MYTAIAGVTANVYSQKVACLVTFEVLCESSLGCVAAYQGDLERMWDFLRQRYSANTTSRKAAVQSALIQMRYTGCDMQDYIAR